MVSLFTLFFTLTNRMGEMWLHSPFGFTHHLALLTILPDAMAGKFIWDKIRSLLPCQSDIFIEDFTQCLPGQLVVLFVGKKRV